MSISGSIFSVLAVIPRKSNFQTILSLIMYMVCFYLIVRYKSIIKRQKVAVHLLFYVFLLVFFNYITTIFLYPNVMLFSIKKFFICLSLPLLVFLCTLLSNNRRYITLSILKVFLVLSMIFFILCHIYPQLVDLRYWIYYDENDPLWSSEILFGGGLNPNRSALGYQMAFAIPLFFHLMVSENSKAKRWNLSLFMLFVISCLLLGERAILVAIIPCIISLFVAGKRFDNVFKNFIIISLSLIFLVLLINNFYNVFPSMLTYYDYNK